MSERISIKKNPYGACLVYRGALIIACIADHRKTSRITTPTVRDNWAVLWCTGRVDWHGTLSEARDNALKGN